MPAANPAKNNSPLGLLRNRHRRSSEVDSNRCELSRSPGSRFFEMKLPSQCIAAPVANPLHSSALTVAGPLRISTGFPYKTELQELYGNGDKSVKVKSRKVVS
jgi:hypothetical protein